MVTNVIGIFGKTCSGKSDIARELSRLTGNKVKHPGEAVTSRARSQGLTSGKDVDDGWHRQVDEDTLALVGGLEELWIIESGMLDVVLGAREDVFWVQLKSDDEARVERWNKRREEGGGRSRQIGESIAQRDADDATLRNRLYPGATGVTAQLVIDSSQRSYSQCAADILSAFQSETGVTLTVAKAEMDKTASKGISPGSSSGVVRSFTPKRAPFGGYITDERSGKDLYVHKSQIANAGIAVLSIGQRVDYQVVEDGFGGFKATELRLSD